jgi:predicted CXXCH cytochrome family protein
MSIRSVFFALLLFCAYPAGAAFAQDIFTIHYPPDKIIKEYGLLGVTFSLTKGIADKVVVRVNNKSVKELSSFAKINCFSVHLEPGINTIEFVALKDDALINKMTRNVFRRSDLIGAYKHWPPDYRRDSFHSGKRELCAECHQLEPTEVDRLPVNVSTPSVAGQDGGRSKKTSTCYSCHQGITSYPFVHGPAAAWICLSCHDENSMPRYAVAKPDSEACYKCHLDKKQLWLNKKYRHGPVTLGKCTICHNPHAEKNAFNLYKRTWDLCVNCHFEMGSGRHILGDSFSQEGHPTKEKDDPVRKGRELTCASCHDPHASDFPHMWAFDVENIFELCQKCHQKMMN